MSHLISRFCVGRNHRLLFLSRFFVFRCYVDRLNNCNDARPSVHGAPYPWSCQACRNRRKCECNGHYNRHGYGECNTHWHGGTWYVFFTSLAALPSAYIYAHLQFVLSLSRCYIDNDNNCPDAMRSMQGVPYRWSYQACRNQPLGLIRSFSADAEMKEA